VLGCIVHVLGHAACRCGLCLGPAPFDAKSLGPCHSRSQALILRSHRVGVFHQAKAHRPCALWVPAFGEQAPALDQVVDSAASEARSKEGFLDVGQELRVREEVVGRACHFNDEDLLRGTYPFRLLGAVPVDVVQPHPLFIHHGGRCIGCSALRDGSLRVARRSSGGAAHGGPGHGCRAHRCRGPATGVAWDTGAGADGAGVTDWLTTGGVGTVGFWNRGG
jgi:hypothetical protein